MDAITKLEQEIKNPGKLSRIEAAMQGLPEENRNKIRANVRSTLERMLEEVRDE